MIRMLEPVQEASIAQKTVTERRRRRDSQEGFGRAAVLCEGELSGSRVFCVLAWAERQSFCAASWITLALPANNTHVGQHRPRAPVAA